MSIDESLAAEWVDPGDLVPWPDNPRLNGNSVVAVAKSIKRFGFGAPIVARLEDRMIIAGHTRWKAAQKLGLKTVPVRFMRGLSNAEAAALALADNRLTDMTPWDTEGLATVLADLDAANAAVDFLDFGGLLGDTAEEDREVPTYTAKIERPIYEPKGEKPPTSSLVDVAVCERLTAAIDAANLPSDVAAFLRAAATRHMRFDFQNIAEWYCHAPPEVQRLVEQSALVIVDFDQAVELGYVKLTEAFQQTFLADKS